MNITGHRLKDAAFVKAHASGGAMVPTLIILHDTAGRVEKLSSVNWFKSEDCTTSAHVVVERDGTITQMVDFNKRAFHAGASDWKGVSNCNAFSIGIEIVNPGKLDKDGHAWFHKKTEKGFTGIKRAKTAVHGDGWWLDYTPEQIKAVAALCKALVARYPEIEDITTHWTVSPGRKIDTNPLFPLDALRREVFAVRSEEAVATVEPEPVQPKIEKPIAATVKGSRTIFSTLSAAGAFVVYIYHETIEVILAAAAQFDALAPAAKILSALGISVAGIAIITAFASLAGAIFARLDDARKGHAK